MGDHKMDNENSILRLPAVMKLTGLGRSTIYLYMKQGLFPQNVQITHRAVGWFYTDIVEWINERSYVNTD